MLLSCSEQMRGTRHARPSDWNLAGTGTFTALLAPGLPPRSLSFSRRPSVLQRPILTVSCDWRNLARWSNRDSRGRMLRCRALAQLATRIASPLWASSSNASRAVCARAWSSLPQEFQQGGLPELQSHHSWAPAIRSIETLPFWGQLSAPSHGVAVSQRLNPDCLPFPHAASRCESQGAAWSFAASGLQSRVGGEASVAESRSALQEAPAAGASLGDVQLAGLFPITVGSLWSDVPMEASSVKRKRVSTPGADGHRPVPKAQGGSAPRLVLADFPLAHRNATPPRPMSTRTDSGGSRWAESFSALGASLRCLTLRAAPLSRCTSRRSKR